MFVLSKDGRGFSCVLHPNPTLTKSVLRTVDLGDGLVGLWFEAPRRVGPDGRLYEVHADGRLSLVREGSPRETGWVLPQPGNGQRCEIPGDGARTPAPRRVARQSAREPGPDCLIPPNKVRWEGEIELQARCWHLLACLLRQRSWPVPFGVVERAVWAGKYPATKTVQNAVYDLAARLEEIRFPWQLSTKSTHIYRD